MNVVNLVGRLVRDPELRVTQNQMSVCKVTLAVDRPVRGDEEKKSDFINITVFGKQADVFAKYLTKGRQVAIEGSLRTGSYKNKNGDTVYTTEVAVNRFYFIGTRGDNNPQQGQQKQYAVPEGFEAIDDDIPF